MKAIGTGVFAGDVFEGPLEIWCYKQMRRYHNRGLKLKLIAKRSYHDGIAQGFAIMLDKLREDRKKAATKQRPTNARLQAVNF